MASWVLIPCLQCLFDEFDRIAPRRDTNSDGRIGDTAHSQTSSDHNPDETGTVPIHDADKVNEVHAADVDNQLREPGLTMEDVVQHLLARCRSGAEKRLRYIIYNRRIWSASSGWVQKTYTGTSPHTEHAHFSASYTSSLEASTASWHLEDLMALTSAELDDIAERVWARKLRNPYSNVDQPAGDLLRYAPSRTPHEVTQTKIDALAAAITQLDVVDDADRAAIVAGVLAGLSPEAIAAAIPRDLAAQVAGELAARLAA